MPTRSIHDKYKGINAIDPHVKETLHQDRGGGPPGAEECIAQVDRLVRSPLFLGSEALCKLLKYLAHHTIHTPTDHLKEYKIATEVFGRHVDFDPQTDSYVRVQMGRLRSKLAHYYETEGAADAVLVDVPKGRYVLAFDWRGEPAEARQPGEADAAAQKSIGLSGVPSRVKRLALPAAAVLLTVGIAVLAFGAFQIHAPGGAPLERLSVGNRADALTRFWSPFVQGPDEPIVVFANANFVGDAETGMRYYEPSRDPHAEITQHYTGVGEVLGVLELDRLFQERGREFRVKRGSLFTLDEARSNNLIFVGSPTENLTLDQIPGTQEFVFRDIATGPDRWQEVIVNAHPRAGESSVYTPSDSRGHEGDDYAVVALRHGLDPSRWTLILAGTSTIGTQAAVDYVCDAGSVQSLLKQLKVSKTADLKPFEALLRVRVANDVPLAVQLVELRQMEK